MKQKTMNSVLTLETNKYSIKLDNFEGPLDLLCHLIEKNKMDINQVKISDITDQYIEYLNKMQEMNLEIASEFIVMASTLIYIKSKSLLPKQNEDEEELTEEQLLQRIIEYKKYKEIIKTLREQFNEYSKRFYKTAEQIELPNRTIEDVHVKDEIIDSYTALVEKNNNKINENAANIEKIAIIETVTVASKVKDVFKELLRKPKFVFSSLCKEKKYTKLETVTALSGILELTRRNKIHANQEENFSDIIIEKKK